MNNYLSKLKNAYFGIYEKDASKPDWSMHKKNDRNKTICPTIPFVGKEYGKGLPKMLLYASAENLTDYNGYLDDDMFAIDRHRYFFEISKNKADLFFPNVHIQPITDGGLCIVAKYIYSTFLSDSGDDPCSFLEHISFGNFCKFSIQTESRNIDYAGESSKLDASLDYVASDIEILKPDIIVLPAKIYEKEADFILSIAGGATVIPIIQINSTTVNCFVVKKSNYSKKSISELSPVIREWYCNLKGGGFSGKTKENFLAVFSYLDEVIEKCK